jgi:hypothetical protein
MYPSLSWSVSWETNLTDLFICLQGFFALARTNQSCPPGRHYGEDYYDERMKAATKVYVLFLFYWFSVFCFQLLTLWASFREIAVPKSFNLGVAPSTASERPEKSGKMEQTGQEPRRGQEEQDKCQRDCPQAPLFKCVSALSSAERRTEKTPEPEPAPAVSVNSQPAPEKDEAESTRPAKSQAPKNPLRWFGVLVPPFLSTTQTSFATAVQGPIPELASVITEMREVESKVNELRSFIAAERGRKETS